MPDHPLELPPSKRLRFGYPLAVLVLVLSLVLVLIAWNQLRQRELGLAEEQFRSRAGQHTALVQQHLNSIEVALRGGASLFAVVAEPTRSQWHDYASALQMPLQFPTMVGLGFAASVDPETLVRLQEDMRASGRGRLTIRPQGIRERYGPILFLEPATRENLDAIGYDMYSEPSRRRAMAAAMDSGSPRLTGPLELVQDSSKPETGLILYAPVYASGMPSGSVAERRAAMRGWVYSPFRIRELLDTAIGAGRKRLLLRVVDVTDGEPVVLHQDPGMGDDQAFAISIDKHVHGRQWRFDYFSGPQETAAPQLAGVDRLLLLGLTVSLLLFGLTWTMASTEARARRLAAAMTESSRRNEQRFRNAMQYSAIGKALLDSTGTIIEWNPAFARTVGRAPEELRGTNLNDLLGHESEPVKTSQMQAFDEAGGIIRLTRSLRRGDGEVRHVNLTFAPVPEEPGNDISRLVQVEDVTERIRAEQTVQALNRTLEARVAARTRELSEANRELESFAYSVSHDLRAPLRGIEGFSRLLEERYAAALDPVGRAHLARVRAGAARMGELIEALLKLARIRRTEADLAEVDVSSLAREVAADLRDANPGRQVDMQIQPGMTARADRPLLRNLLDNLLGNAWKFTRDVAEPRIELFSWRDARGATWFEVRDNGAGFDPAYVDKLFKPFQRLHRQEEFAGHGIGLASVKRIIERHGGTIEAEGAPGQGARFRFTLESGGNGSD